MNPFDWNGPEFLLFYFLLSVVAIATQWWMRRVRELAASNPAATPKLSDPYLVAYLAGGVNALIRCVTVTLVERKVLRIDGESTVAFDRSRSGLLQSPLEGEVASFFHTAGAAHSAFKGLADNPAVTAVSRQYRASLEAAGLVPSEAQKSANRYGAWAVFGLLVLVAVVKYNLAIARGHHNVAFLIIFAIAGCFISMRVASKSTTAPGREALADLQQLFAGLKDQTRAGNAANVNPADVALVAAVFGLGALGGQRQVYAKSLYPSASSSSGCGSSCGSSSSGGDGGGDGGSSCGGSGCGGCGGGGE